MAPGRRFGNTVIARRVATKQARNNGMLERLSRRDWYHVKPRHDCTESQSRSKERSNHRNKYSTSTRCF